MSLDVHLIIPGATTPAGTGIFVRENGAQREITRAEWDERFPGLEPVTAGLDDRGIYSRNITHNLGRMAREADLYAACWTPEKIGATHARDLIAPLEAGLERLKSDPERFRAFDAPNGWGKYEDFVAFVTNYLAACRKWPEALVSVCR